MNNRESWSLNSVHNSTLSTVSSLFIHSVTHHVHRHRSSVNFRGHDIFAQKNVWKIIKMPEFYMITAQKIIKIPEFLYLPEY